MDAKKLHEREDTAIGCSIGAVILLGLALLCLFSMFSFTSLFSDISSVYALIFLFFVFMVVLHIQHTHSENKVSGIKFKYNNEYEELKKQKEKNEYEHKRLMSDLQFEYNKKTLDLQTDYSKKEERLKELINSKSPLKYLATAYADAVTYVFTESAKYLRYKSHPALTASEEVKRMKKEARQHAADAKMYQYQYEMLLSTMPDAEDEMKDDGTMDIVKDYYEQNMGQSEDYDKVQDYVTKSEYATMSIDDRNQLALDRYMSRHKNNWQIGRDYEMYICHWLRCEGYTVEHTGIQGLQDLGRDIIAHKDGIDYVIQCKYWGHKKVIREKYIMQLFGTTVAYNIQHSNLYQSKGIFVTNIDLSETAQQFAKFLRIKVIKKPIGEYPVIKCNINQGNKIYHLPFDQQYDRTQICNPGEFFASTVKEAVDAGFRRAYRHNFYKD